MRFEKGGNYFWQKAVSNLGQSRQKDNNAWITIWPLKLIHLFDLNRHCAQWSVYDIKVLREWFESIRIHVMSYTDHSAQRHFKSLQCVNCSSSGSSCTSWLTDVSCSQRWVIYSQINGAVSNYTYLFRFVWFVVVFWLVILFFKLSLCFLAWYNVFWIVI